MLNYMRLVTEGPFMKTRPYPG